MVHSTVHGLPRAYDWHVLTPTKLLVLLSTATLVFVAVHTFIAALHCAAGPPSASQLPHAQNAVRLAKPSTSAEGMGPWGMAGSWSEQIAALPQRKQWDGPINMDALADARADKINQSWAQAEGEALHHSGAMHARSWSRHATGMQVGGMRLHVACKQCVLPPAQIFLCRSDAVTTAAVCCHPVYTPCTLQNYSKCVPNMHG